MCAVIAAALTLNTHADQTLRIGAWNIEHLGSPNSRAQPNKGVAQDPAMLADYIMYSKVVVLGLEEIYMNTGTNRNSTLDSAFAHIKNKTGEQWNYVLFKGKNGDKSQVTGVAWNTARVKPMGEPKPILSGDPGTLADKNKPGQKRSLWDRTPHGVKLQTSNGKTDFVVVPLHMKADVGGNYDYHREKEAEILAEALPDAFTAFNDKDFILIGDANVDDSAEGAIKKLDAAGFKELNKNDKPTHVRYGALDRVFVPEEQKEFKESPLAVSRDNYLNAQGWNEAEFRKRLSDHFMVVTEIAVMNDDD